MKGFKVLQKYLGVLTEKIFGVKRQFLFSCFICCLRLVVTKKIQLYTWYLRDQSRTEIGAEGLQDFVTCFKLQLLSFSCFFCCSMYLWQQMKFSEVKYSHIGTLAMKVESW